MTVTFTPIDEVETLWVITDRLRVLGRFPGSTTHLIEVEVPPGAATPPHTHVSPELFVVSDGVLTIRSFGPGGTTTRRLEAGDSVAVSSMEPHNYANETDAPVRFLVLLEDSMIAFFRDVGRPEPLPAGAAPDIPALMAAMARHGIAVVPQPG